MQRNLSSCNSFLLQNNICLSKRNSSIKESDRIKWNKSPQIKMSKVAPRNIFERLFQENMIIKEEKEKTDEIHKMILEKELMDKCPFQPSLTGEIKYIVKNPLNVYKKNQEWQANLTKKYNKQDRNSKEDKL